MWKTHSGRLIAMQDLAESHLLSIERMLLGRGAREWPDRERLFTEHYGAIRDEIERRGLGLLADHGAALERQE